MDLLAVPDRVPGRRGPDRDHHARGVGAAPTGPGGPDLFSAQALASAGARTRRRTRWRFAGRSRTSASGTSCPGSSTTRVRAYPTAPVAQDHELAGLPPGRAATSSSTTWRPGSWSFRGPGLNGDRAGSGSRWTRPDTATAARRRASIVITEVRVSAYKVRCRSTRDGDGDSRSPFASHREPRVVLVMPNASTSFRCWTGDHAVRLLRRCAGRPEPQLHVPRQPSLTRPQSASALTGNGSAIGS